MSIFFQFAYTPSDFCLLPNLRISKAMVTDTRTGETGPSWLVGLEWMWWNASFIYVGMEAVDE